MEIIKTSLTRCLTLFAVIHSASVIADDADCSPKQTLEEFSYTQVSDTSLVTAEIYSGYGVISKSPAGTGKHPKTLGVRVTSSLPTGEVDLDEYINEQLMIKDGGTLNLFFSLNTSADWFSIDCSNKKKLTDNLFVRPYQPDRTYLSLFSGENGTLPPIILPYMVHGIGIKAIRSKVDNGDDDSTGGAASAYLGIGIEGPIFPSKATTPSSEGNLDIQVSTMATRTGNKEFQIAYGSDYNNQIVYSAHFSLGLQVQESLAIRVNYSGPIATAKNYADEVLSFSFAYNK